MFVFSFEFVWLYIMMLIFSVWYICLMWLVIFFWFVLVRQCGISSMLFVLRCLVFCVYLIVMCVVLFVLVRIGILFLQVFVVMWIMFEYLCCVSEKNLLVLLVVNSVFVLYGVSYFRCLVQVFGWKLLLMLKFVSGNDSRLWEMICLSFCGEVMVGVVCLV